MDKINLDLHLYGSLARYGNSETPGYAHINIVLPQDSTMKDILGFLRIPKKERGITFINGNLSALPGLQPDQEHILNDNDRIAIFDLKSMWPFQYRHGVVMIEELSKKLKTQERLRHNFEHE